MRKRLASMIGLAALGALALAPPAPAATEFGDDCAATTSSDAPITYFALTATGRPVQLAAPTAGVITKWRSNLAAAPFPLPHSLKVLRLVGPEDVKVIDEAHGSLTAGQNVFDARIPVQAGDRLGLFGSSDGGTVYCEIAGPESSFGIFPAADVGETIFFAEVSDQAGIPVAAVIEPDADGDGFGDETQDRCPQNAALQAPCPSPPPPAPDLCPQIATVQTACPLVILDALGVVRKRAVIAYVATSSAAPVTVRGTVKLRKGKKVTLRAAAQTVPAGKLARFKLNFPAALRKRLKRLPRKKKLTLRITAEATNVAGVASADRTRTKLKGRAR